MVNAQEPPWGIFRALYDALLEYESPDLWEGLLRSWLDTEDGLTATAWLASFAARTGDPIPASSPEELWSLYALSRTNDRLIAAFQTPGGENDRFAQLPWLNHLALTQYAAFMTRLGFRAEPDQPFTPFLHEIVGVEQAADDATRPTIGKTLWPAFMLGPMLFSRGGVTISSGRIHVRKEVAETSKMYWAYLRRHRPYDDLSQGWGSNSQWRTNLRRDYRFSERLFLNVDVGPNEARDFYRGNPDKLTPVERRELLLHRCFVRSDGPSEDLYPYVETGLAKIGEV